MTKKSHQRVWHKKVGKIMPSKTMIVQQGKKINCPAQAQDDDPKTVFAKKFREQIKKAL
ncbi:MAG: hypothetical protein PHY73_03040 [Candidatus Omnitrophica bacterium]|nr:hypothetical protein [Candidatus Omnitrophota bacterium]